MTAKFLSVYVIALVLTSAWAVKLPASTGTVKITELIEKDVMGALQKHDNELSRQIQTLISLSLSEGQYDEIFNVLSELWDDLQTDRRTELTSFAATEGALNAEISTFATGMSNAESARDQASRDFDSYSQMVNILVGQLAQLATDIESVNGQITELDNQRRLDAQAFEGRQRSHESTLQALDIIVSDLGDIQRNNGGATELAEIKQVIQRMKKIGHSNPLLSLVEFSTTFDPETLATVITKLVAIRENVAASGADDVEDERRAVAAYNALRGGMTTQLNGYVAEQSTKRGAKTTNEGLRDDAQATFNSESQKYETQRGFWEGKKVELVEATSAHQNRLSQIDSEIATIEEAQDILQANLGYAQEHMNN